MWFHGAAAGLKRRCLGVVVGVAVAMATAQLAFAQGGQANVFSTRAVGGVMIDPQGMVTRATVADLADLRQALADWLGPVPEGLNQPTQTRRISLKRVEQTLAECTQTGKEIPDSLLYLGGLQRVDYVLVYPDQHDVVLVGPAEPWRADERGTVVGQSTGRPVMLLDDLVVALRAAVTKPSVISCSIDPTPEGVQRFNAAAKRLRGVNAATIALLQTQLGPQQIRVTGVPENSHFARVMVAADYRMKRIGIDLEPAPVAGLPSFLDVARSPQNMLPRWWLAPDYQPLVRDAEGLAWHIRGRSVKVMTESDYLGQHGIQRGAGRPDRIAQRWAELFTERYDELAQADPVFGQLRNLMDMAVVAALVAKEQLLQRAGLDLPVLLGRQPGYGTLQLPAPRQVPSQAALARRGRGWLVAAGGVEINAWQIVQQSETGQIPAAIRDYSALGRTAQWWAD